MDRPKRISEAFNVGSIENTNKSLRLSQHLLCNGQIANAEATFNTSEPTGSGGIDDLNEMDFRPDDQFGTTNFTSVMRGAQRFANRLFPRTKPIGHLQNRVTLLHGLTNPSDHFFNQCQCGLKQ